MVSLSEIERYRSRLNTHRLSKLGQTTLLGPLQSIRPSIFAGVGFAGLALGSHFVPPKQKGLKQGLMIAAALSGAAAAWLFYIGR